MEADRLYLMSFTESAHVGLWSLFSHFRSFDACSNFNQKSQYNLRNRSNYLYMVVVLVNVEYAVRLLKASHVF